MIAPGLDLRGCQIVDEHDSSSIRRQFLFFQPDYCFYNICLTTKLERV